MIVQQSPADPLSDILIALQVTSSCSVRLQAGGDWSLRFKAALCKFNAVRKGSVWLLSDGKRQRLAAGDCLFAKAGAEFTLTSDPMLEPVDAAVAFADDPRLGRHGTADDVEILGGSISFGVANELLLLDLLPPTMVIDAESGAAQSMGWLIDRLDAEWKSSQPGSLAACNDLLRLMFVLVLRLYMQQDHSHGLGFISALADPPIAATIKAIHNNPYRRWTVGSLAKIAYQSRSAFAANFRARVGVSPIGYATQLRLTLAASQLKSTRHPISKISSDLGYLSDSAFSNAFKRQFGVSPKRYRAIRQ